VGPPLARLRLARPLVVIDVEATGLSPSTARVVEVAAFRLAPGDRPKMLCTRVNPGCAIPPAATAVHRITDRDVRHKPPFAAVARPLADLLAGCDLAGFNLAAYDLPLLAHEFARAGVPFPLAGRAVVDVYRLFTRQEPRDLAAAVRFYLGRDHDGAHAAAADALATAEVLDRQLARYPDLPPDPAGLHRLLVEVDVGRRFRRGRGGAVLLNFGRFQGVALAEVAGHDPAYLRWVLTTDLLDDARALVERALAGRPIDTSFTDEEGP
jgi:DNA polymerase-3 subunit epsilon